MENLKIKVNNESESKEVQELFFELGFEKGMVSGNYPNTIVAIVDSKIIDYHFSSSATELEHREHKYYKELTLHQLRDLVVLKRNDVGDATHENNHGQKLYKAQKGWYIYVLGSWLWNDESLGYTPIQLKPVEKKEMKEYLNKKTFEVIKSNDNGYFDFGLDVRDWIEIPAGAVKAYLNNSKTINFVNYDDDYMNGVTDGKWVNTHCGKHEICGHTLVWQRKNLNDQVASAEEFKQPEDLPFVDSKIDIDVENLPEFKPFNNGPVEHDSTAFTNLGIEYPIGNEIKKDFPLNRGDINCRAAIAFNAIRGTDLTEDDVSFLCELLNSITNHYGA